MGRGREEMPRCSASNHQGHLRSTQALEMGVSWGQRRPVGCINLLVCRGGGLGSRAVLRTTSILTQLPPAVRFAGSPPKGTLRATIGFRVGEGFVGVVGHWFACVGCAREWNPHRIVSDYVVGPCWEKVHSFWGDGEWVGG